MNGVEAAKTMLPGKPSTEAGQVTCQVQHAKGLPVGVEVCYGGAVLLRRNVLVTLQTCERRPCFRVSHGGGRDPARVPHCRVHVFGALLLHVELDESTGIQVKDHG